MSWAKTIKFLLISFWRALAGLDYQHDAAFDPLLFPGEFFPGRGKRFIESLKRKDYPAFLTLMNSMLISVKGCLPRPDLDCRNNAIVDWFKDLFLCQKAPRDEDLAFRIRQYVHEFIGNRVCSVEQVYLEPKVPSTSANYVYGRNNGGSVSTLIEDPFFRDIEVPTYNDIVMSQTFEWSDSKDSDGNSLFVMDGNVPRGDTLIDKSVIQKNFFKVFKHCVDKAFVEEPIIQPVALSEALKVRMITKCPPYLMFVMNSFIDPLRKLLRGESVFELTGSPQDENIVDRNFPYTCRWFCSGDYVASTDRLHSWVSECIVDELCETYFRKVCHYDPRWIELFRRSLTGFVCQADDKFDKKSRVNHSDYYRQQRGQLMGSVSSFPILCLANYALCRMAQELNPPDWRGLLINGDDCVFESNIDCYNEWIRLGHIMGLSPSPGKVDYAQGRIQMNSRVFVPLPNPDRADADLANSRNTFADIEDNENHIYCLSADVAQRYRTYARRTWWQCPMFLAGVASGMTRSSVDDTECLNLSLCDMRASKDAFEFELKNAPRWLLKSSQEYFKWTFSQAVFDELTFAKSHRKTRFKTRQFLKTISFNLPKKYGGLGMLGEPDDRDKRLALYMYDHGLTLPIGGEKTWLFHNKVQKILSVNGRVPSPGLDCNYGPLYWYALTLFKDDVWKQALEFCVPEDARLYAYQRLARLSSSKLDEYKKLSVNYQSLNSYVDVLTSGKSNFSVTYLNELFDIEQASGVE
jgi:hypothetical protein